MIPRTFPSTFASNGQQQMVVHFLTSVEGLARWSDYIPVKLAQGGPENSYSGCIDVVAISELTADTQAWKEYIPVYADSSATDAWTVNSVGYIPYNYALFADAAMQLDLTNGAALDPRITFSRTTNATLTNSAGLIANAPMNLLTFSEQFDNSAWVKTGTPAATVSANLGIAPDGTQTADLISNSIGSAAAQVYQAYTSTGVVVTFSIYLKADTATSASILLRDITAAINLTSTASVLEGPGSVSGATVITVTGLATDRWTRVQLTLTAAPPSGNQIRSIIYPETSSAGTGKGVFIWGAQLEVGSTATTYNPTTVKNLLGFTENFDNAAWTKSNATISATKVDDIYGQPFAQKLVEDTNTGAHRVGSNAPVLAGDAPYTLSFYAKAAERTQVYGLIAATTAGSRTLVRFDLSDETVVVVSGAPTSTSVQAIGSGWYRCAITYTTAASPTGTSQIIGIWNGTESYTGDGTSGIYIFGAQLSDSASVDPYVYQPVAAPTSTAYYGPRFDYDPVTLAPKGLLIEEQRTQLLLNSSLAGTSLATQNVTVAAVAHTLSFYGTGTVTLSGVSTAGPLVGTGAYPNRATLTFTPTAGTLTLTVTGTVQFAQLEAGAFATSFIPSAASQVTRAADNASMIGNNFARWYNQTEGTFYAQAASFGDAAVRYMTFASDATNSNRIAQYFTLGGTTGLVTAGGTSQASMSVSGTTAAKVSLAYATDNFAFARNATLATDSAGTVPVGLTQMQIGAGLTAATSPLNGTISRIAYYNRRLANTEIQGLTS